MEVKPVIVLTAVITGTPFTGTGPYTLVIPGVKMFVVVTEFEAYMFPVTIKVAVGVEGEPIPTGFA